MHLVLFYKQVYIFRIIVSEIENTRLASRWVVSNINFLLLHFSTSCRKIAFLSIESIFLFFIFSLIVFALIVFGLLLSNNSKVKRFILERMNRQNHDIIMALRCWNCNKIIHAIDRRFQEYNKK